MLFLKQSTAVTVKIGPFVDSVDGDTAETGLTISQADVRLSKNGGNIAQKNESTSCTHDELGVYDCPIDATDTNTLGRLQLWVHESGALPVWHEFIVVTANVWDTLCSTDKFDVNLASTDDIDFSATMKASLNTEVDDALNTAIPGSPTANSINERVKAIDDKLPSGTISDFDESANDVALTATGIDEILDEVIEGSTTLRQALRLFLSVLVSKSSGGGTATLVFRDIGDSKARVTATVDSNGNRTAMTLDAT